VDDKHDADGFDADRRREVSLRFVALNAGQDREALVASRTPNELAQHDLAAMLEFRRQYHAGETAFHITDANTGALDRQIDELRRTLESLEEP
jgi:hypothetical protein